jgi:O-antigen ligase
MNLPPPSLQRSLPTLCLLIYVCAVSIGTFTGGLWASLGIGGALLMYGGTCLIEHKRPSLNTNFTSFVGIVILAIGLLNFHSAFPSVWHSWAQLITILIPLSLLFSPDIQAHIFHPRFFSYVSLFASIGACALGLELALGCPLLHFVRGINASATEYNRGISYLIVFAFPLMAYLWKANRKWVLALFIFILLIPTSLTDSRATRMALILGLATTVLSFIAPLMTRRGLALLLLASVLCPFAVTTVFIQYPDWIDKLPPSWHHRVEIWDYMSYRIFEHPFLGWGLGTSSQLAFEQPHGDLYQYVKMAAPHPHNFIIQLWVELGLIGLILGFTFALYILHKAALYPSTIRPFAFGAWVAAWSISLVAYNFWTDSLFAMFTLTSFAFILLKSSLHSEV